MKFNHTIFLSIAITTATFPADHIDQKTTIYENCIPKLPSHNEQTALMPETPHEEFQQIIIKKCQSEINALKSEYMLHSRDEKWITTSFKKYINATLQLCLCLRGKSLAEHSRNFKTMYAITVTASDWLSNYLQKHGRTIKKDPEFSLYQHYYIIIQNLAYLTNIIEHALKEKNSLSLQKTLATQSKQLCQLLDAHGHPASMYYCTLGIIIEEFSITTFHEVWRYYQTIKTNPLQQHLRPELLSSLNEANLAYHKLRNCILHYEPKAPLCMLSITSTHITDEVAKYKLKISGSLLYLLRQTQNQKKLDKEYTDLENATLLECTSFVKKPETLIEIKIAFLIEMIEHSFRLSQLNLETLTHYKKTLDDLIAVIKNSDTEKYFVNHTELEQLTYILDVKIAQATLDKACIEQDKNYTIVIPANPLQYADCTVFLNNYKQIVQLDSQQTESHPTCTDLLKNLIDYSEKIAKEHAKKTLTKDLSMSILYACVYSVKKFNASITLDDLVIILQNYFDKQHDPYITFCIAYCGANLATSPDLKKLLYFMEHMTFFIEQKTCVHTIPEKYIIEIIERIAHFILELSPHNKELCSIFAQWIKHDALSNLDKAKLDDVKNKLFLAQTFELWYSNPQTYQSILECLTNTFQKSKKQLIPPSVRQNMLMLCSKSADNILVDQFETLELWFEIQKKIAKYLNNNIFHISKLHVIADEELNAHEKSGGFNNDRLTILLTLLKKIDNKDVENASVYYHKVKAALDDQC